MEKFQEALLILLIALPFIGSVVIGFFRSTAENREAWFAGAVALFGLLLTLSFYPFVTGGHVVYQKFPWLPQWGLDFTLRLDGLAWLFLLLITGIGLLIVIYARYYMNPADPVPRFFSFLLAFMGAMSGIVLSGNLILLVVFWELTSIFSFLLIGYWYHNASARDGARMALIVTGFGGFALLVGVLIIGHVVGSYDLDVVLQAGDTIRKSPLYTPALLCFLLGAMTKSAQFPFHFWLPGAMAAPTPVSAYLHSATLVKAGIFLLIRLWPVLADTNLWFWILCGCGLTTLLLGAYFAMFQQDLKGLLAYSTISHLGLITSLLSLSSPLGCVAAIFHLVNHATFKASLFMAAGIIDHETGTRDMRKLSGLYRYMPHTATLAIIASAAMAGIPLLNGFLSKEMFFAEAVVTHVESWLDRAMPYVGTLAGLFSVTYSVRFIYRVFFGPKPQNLPKTPHEPPHFMRLPVELLVLICLFVGIAPNFSIGPALATAVYSVLGVRTPHYQLALWHGFNAPFVMSLIALFGGVLLYIIIRPYLAAYNGAPLFFRHFYGKRLFERLMVLISWRWARRAEQIFGTRRLQTQMRWIIIALCLFILLALWGYWPRLGSVAAPMFDPVFFIIWVIGGGCAVGAAWKAKFHRLTSLIFLGGAGLMTCATFLWLSAPDLALTQLLVEIVTTVLLLLGLRWLPKRWRDPDPKPAGWLASMRRLYDLSLAVFGGAGVAWLAYNIMNHEQKETISTYFLRHAHTEAGGRNVVNVLLVDFRGFDTMGEITVLGIVALGVYALLRRFRPAPESIEPPSQQQIQTAFDIAQPSRKEGDMLHDYMAVPSIIMHWLFPVIVVFAIYLFLRGHDAPGGGFAAGVTLAIGFILQYLAAGTRWVERHLRILPLRWMGTGLLIALATGAGALGFGFPFLTSFFGYLDIPLVGKVPIASATLFDLGVFTLVVGATVLMLIAIAHQSIRRYRIRHKNMLQRRED